MSRVHTNEYYGWPEGWTVNQVKRFLTSTQSTWFWDLFKKGAN